MASDEMYGFVFSVSFIFLFSILLSTIPAGLYGPALTPDMPSPVNPNLVTDFTETEDWTRTDFTSGLYEYDLGGKSWRCVTSGTSLILASKLLIGGIIWLGQLDLCRFIAGENGEDRGTTLTIAEIALDADDGEIRYTLQFESNGNYVGGFVVYWNITEYEDPVDAWTADELYLMHGVGIDTTAYANIGALLVSLLLLQLPDVPLLINAIIAIPIWACVVFVIWYIIKEMIPFL